MVAVPAKDLENAKQRLVTVLSERERRALARTMLEDVLAAITEADLDEVVVVTRDSEVIALAQRFPIAILEEPANRGHTEAVALAQRVASERGAPRFLTIPGDVPLVTPQEIAALMNAAPPGPGAVFVPSRSGFGTNAALLTPPDLMPLKFGEPSFANHLSAARSLGLDPVVCSLPALGLDIDGPEDLRSLLESQGETRSRRLLETLAVLPRLAGQRP
ncbi:MAG: 2-phospho-L-lactate guanylyltransferase [Candidatus Methylomirabilia bacterium]